MLRLQLIGVVGINHMELEFFYQRVYTFKSPNVGFVVSLALFHGHLGLPK